MTRQIRNDQMESQLAGSFTTRDEFCSDGARLLSALYATHRQGGSLLGWAWPADTLAAWTYLGSQVLTGTNIGAADFFATGNGGPYVDFDGTTEYISGGDVAWAEAGTNTMLVWMWCNADTLATNDRIICSKWGAVNNYQWHLFWDLGNAAFQFEVSANGAAINAVTSTYTEAVSTWYFVGGYFTPSVAAGLRIYVRSALDTTMTLNTAASPAGVFTAGTSAFEIGSENVGTNKWDGKIGVGHMRLNVPFASVDGYVARLYALTRLFYQA